MSSTNRHESSPKRPSIFASVLQKRVREKACSRLKSISRAMWSIFSYYLCNKDKFGVSFDRWHEFLADCKIIPRIRNRSRSSSLMSYPMTRDEAGLLYVGSTASTGVVSTCIEHPVRKSIVKQHVVYSIRPDACQILVYRARR